MNMKWPSWMLVLPLAIASGAVTAQIKKVPQAYINIATEVGVPPKLLFAIAMQESRMAIADMTVLPWPWTINIEGNPARFHTRREAVHAIEAAVLAGKRNIDVGLMQVNLKYHERRFNSLEEAINPYTNIQAGAQILLEEYQSCDADWWCAVGQYHSRTPERADRYRNSVRKLWAQLQDNA